MEPRSSSAHAKCVQARRCRWLCGSLLWDRDATTFGLSRLFDLLPKYSVVCLPFCKRGEGQQGHRGSTSLGNEMVEWQGAQDPRSELAS